jgi:O-methyltransferase
MASVRNIVQAQIRRFGYELRRVDIRQPSDDTLVIRGLPHSVVRPQATYSPWLADDEFLKAYRVISSGSIPHTFVDQYRCYELWNFVARLPPGDILEIGVWRGGTGCLMARKLQIEAPDRFVFLCDTFTGVVGTTDNDPSYSDGEHADASEQIVLDLAAEMKLTNVRILRGIFPRDTGDQIADRPFGLIHIDVDVYKSAKECFEWAFPRLSVGGAVVFDDYGFERCGGVTKMVNELRGDRMAMVHNLNGHALIIKTST